MYKIYKITNIKNNKIYVGQTKGKLSDRFKRHIYDAMRGLNTHFAKAIRQYGESSFEYVEIDNVKTKQEADEREKYWIRELKATTRGIGYNSTEGGDGGNTYLKKSKDEMKIIGQKISNRLKGENNARHTIVYIKNIKTNEIIKFGSMLECSDYLNEKHSIIKNRLWWATHYPIQPVYKNELIFSATPVFSKYSFRQTKNGETPCEVTDLKTGKIVLGVSKTDCALQLGLESKRSLESKRFKIKHFIVNN